LIAGGLFPKIDVRLVFSSWRLATVPFFLLWCVQTVLHFEDEAAVLLPQLAGILDSFLVIKVKGPDGADLSAAANYLVASERKGKEAKEDRTGPQQLVRLLFFCC
jgi:hypothetical protein